MRRKNILEKFLNFLNNDKRSGMSLIELMIGAGILGGVGLFVADLGMNLQKTQKEIYTNDDVMAMRSAIDNVVSRTANCTAAFQGRALNGSVTSISKNLDGTDVDFVTAGARFGERLEVTAITLDNQTVPDAVSGGGYGLVNLNVVYTTYKGKDRTSAGRTFTETFPITVFSTDGVNITNCNTLAIAGNGPQETICVAYGGTWDSGAGRCDLLYSDGNTPIYTGTPPITPSAPNDYVISTETLGENLTHYGTNYLYDPATDTNIPDLVVTDNDKISSGGDQSINFVGAVNVTGNTTFDHITVGTQTNLIINGVGTRTTYGAQACPAGQILANVNANGTVTCRDISCTSTEMFVGLDASGNAICNSIPTAACSTGQYIESINADGSYNCAAVPTTITDIDCGAGNVLMGINADSTPICASEASGVGHINMQCSGGGNYPIMTGISSESAVCANVEVEVGPDASCVDISTRLTPGTHSTNTATSTWDFQCPDGFAIVGVDGYENNMDDDHRYRCCPVSFKADPGSGSCALPWGGTVSDGQSVTAYQTSSVTHPSTCTSETRTCTSGTLSGSYTNADCTTINGPCDLPWGGSINHGDTVTGWEAATAAESTGSTCNSQTRTCSNGELDGEYDSETCSSGCSVSGSQTFAFTGAVQTFAIDGTKANCDFHITVKGAGGGESNTGHSYGAAAAGGGAQFKWNPGATGTLEIVVGEAGNGTYPIYGGGGEGGTSGNNGGGGASAVKFNTTVLAISGGGGGVRRAETPRTNYAGRGGALNNCGEAGIGATATHSTAGCTDTGGDGAGVTSGGEGGSSSSNGSDGSTGGSGGVAIPDFNISGGGGGRNAGPGGGGGYGGGGAGFGYVGASGGGGYINVGVTSNYSAMDGGAVDSNGEVVLHWNPENTNCYMWGSIIADGNSVTAYQQDKTTGTCTSQTRTCTSGVLSGTYEYQACEIDTDWAVVKQSCTGYANCYNSLSEWELNYGRPRSGWGACDAGDLTCLSDIAEAQIIGDWTVDDTTPVIIDGWTSDAGDYVHVYTVGSARHPGTASGNHYRIDPTSDGNGIEISQDYTRLDGIRITGLQGTIWQDGVRIHTSATVENMYIHDLTNNDAAAIMITESADNATIDINNIFVYNTSRGGIEVQSDSALLGNATINVNNATVYHACASDNYCLTEHGTYKFRRAALGIYYSTPGNYTGTVMTVNNSIVIKHSNHSFDAMQSCPSSICTAGESILVGSNNITSDSSAVGVNSITNVTATDNLGDMSTGTKVLFNSLSGTIDLHLGDHTNNRALNNGKDIAGLTTDIDGDAYPSGSYDIGADESGHSGGGPPGSDWAVVRQSCSGHGNCYTSLKDWEDNFGNYSPGWGGCSTGDLTCLSQIATAEIQNDWTAADVNPVTIDGWVTNASNYVSIYTVGSARHTGTATGNHYRIDPNTDAWAAISIEDDFVRIDGIRITGTQNSAGDASGIQTFNTTTVSNVIIHDLTVDDANGFQIEPEADNKTVTINNMIMYNIYQSGIMAYGLTSGSGLNNASITVNNSTLYNVCTTHWGCSNENPTFKQNRTAIGYYRDTTNVYTGTTFEINNTAAFKAGTAAYDTMQECEVAICSGGAGVLSGSNNITDDTSAVGTGSITDVTATDNSGTMSSGTKVLFNSLSGAIDLHLGDHTNNRALNNGKDIAGLTTDIDGDSYPSGDYDIGADESGYSGGGATGTDWAVVRQSCSGITNCYTSLKDWEDNFGNYDPGWGGCTTGDLTCLGEIATAEIQEAWTAADTNLVVFDGWVTDASNYVHVYTTGSARHSGIETGNHYRIDPSVDGNAITIQDDFVHLDGIRITGTSTTTYDGRPIIVHNSATIENMIIHDITATDSDGIFIHDEADNKTITINNVIMYNMVRSGILVYANSAYSDELHNANVNVNNVTMYNICNSDYSCANINPTYGLTHTGIGFYDNQHGVYTGTTLTINNSIVFMSSFANNPSIPAMQQCNFSGCTAGTLTGSNNITDDTSAVGSDSFYNAVATDNSGDMSTGVNTKVLFNSLSGTIDLHLGNHTNNIALNGGKDITGLSEDIDGDTYPAGTPDMGADESGYSGGGTPTSCASGGASVGGYCWYWAAENVDCDDTCSGHGLTYDTATLSYAGSGGSDANCDSVLDALGAPGGGVTTASSTTAGCFSRVVESDRKRGTAGTLSGTETTNKRRACACQ